MEQLIELLQQIQDLAGAGIDALKGATGKKGPPEGESSAENKGEPKEGAPPEGGGQHMGGGGQHMGGGGENMRGGPPPEKSGRPRY